MNMSESRVTTVAFSPDGLTVAAGYDGDSRDGSGVVLWDMVAAKPLPERAEGVAEGRVASVAFSPDGKTVAAGCDEGVVLGTWPRKAARDGATPCALGPSVERCAAQPRRQDTRRRL